MVKVLIAVSGSEIAEKSFNWYFDHIHREGYEVIVCHQATLPSLLSSTSLAAATAPSQLDVNRIIGDYKNKMQNLTVKYEKFLQARKVQYKMLVDVTDIGIGQSIINACSEVGADLIVIGTHGHGAIRRTVFGSITDYILDHARLPIRSNKLCIIMEVVDKHAALLSNYEVLRVLQDYAKEQKKKKRGDQNLSTITYETLKYLDDTPALLQTPESIESVLKSLTFSLTKAEKLQLINLRPTSAVEISLIIEESEERVSEAQIEQILDIISRLPAPPEEQEEEQEEADDMDDGEEA